MRPPLRCALARMLLVAACAAMVTACAATHTTTGQVTAASPTAASPTPQERAVAEAAAILRAFVVPLGGQRLAKAPDVLKVPSATLVSTTLVNDVSFWRAPGQPQAILAWEQAHLPRDFTPEDADFGPPSWDRTFSLTPIPGVLNARDLVVEVVAAGNGQTAIRVDAQVSWQPSPAGLRTGAIRRPRGDNHPAAQPGPARQPPARARHMNSAKQISSAPPAALIP